jgi:hypothetical protein
MAIVANTHTTYDAVGIREDLADVIYNISPEETPFISNASRDTCSATLFDWQIDSLAAADTSNAQIEGDDVAFAAVTPPTRVGNRTQISRKEVVISDTDEVVDKAGRKSELSYQIAKRGSELKRDMEAILLNNQAAAAGSTTTARTAAGFPAWLTTNTDGGVGAADGSLSGGVVGTARTDGTQRDITEDMLKTVMASCWEAGGNPTTLMVGSHVKQDVSAFTGIAQARVPVNSAKATTIIGAADVYVSDFGNLAVVPNRFSRGRDALLIDFDYVSVSDLRPMKTEELAKTGDAEKRMIICEYALRMRNEGAHGIIADLNVS